MKLDPDKTWVPLGGVAAIIIAIALGAWRVSAAVTELRSEVKAAASDRWTASDMQEWGYQLERSNRERQLQVPDARKVRADRLGANSGSGP